MKLFQRFGDKPWINIFSLPFTWPIYERVCDWILNQSTPYYYHDGERVVHLRKPLWLSFLLRLYVWSTPLQYVHRRYQSARIRRLEKKLFESDDYKEWMKTWRKDNECANTRNVDADKHTG